MVFISFFDCFMMDYVIFIVLRIILLMDYGEVEVELRLGLGFHLGHESLLFK